MNLHEWLGLPESVWSPLVLALLHSVWQAGLAAVVLALGLRLASIKYAGLRATLCGIIQAGVLIAFLFTWAILAAPDPEPIPTVATSIENPISIPNTAFEEPLNNHTNINRSNANPPLARSPASPNWPRLIALAWITGTVLMTLRMAHDLAAGWSLVREGTIGSEDLLDDVNRLAGRLGLKRPIRVIMSERIHTPAIFGVLRPILLFPAAPLGLPPEQLEAIVAHELAHIKRRDWLWHFIGRLIEAVLFYNPGVWWLGCLARREREAAADALAIRITQEPAVFATALAEWASRMQKPAKAAVAWDGDAGGLRERVLRVLKPGHQPRVRFSPAGFGAALLAAVFVLAGLRGGAERAVAMAQELLSPAERMERIEEAAVVAEKKVEAVSERVTISGQIRTADGVPLSETSPGGYGRIATQQGNRGYSGTEDSDGKFSVAAFNSKEEFTLTAEWPGHAPFVLGPVIVESRDDLDNLEIVLERGFAGQLKLLDPNGTHIKQAHVEATLSRPAASQAREFKINADGTFFLEHCTEHPYDITVLAPGYERQRFKTIDLKPDTIVPLTLTPTKPTTGLVLGANGKPLGNLPVRLIDEGSHGWSFGVAPTLATTDAQGRFSLTSLKSDVTSIVTAEHDGMSAGFAVVEPGQEGVQIQLGAERTLRGEVIGDLSTIEKPRRGNRPAEYSIYMSINYISEIPGVPENSGTNWGEPVEVIPDPQSGNPPQRGTFEIRDLESTKSLPRGEVTMRAGETETTIEPFNGVKNVTIDLSKIVQYDRPHRKTIIQFVPPHGGDPPARGRVRVDVISRDDDTEERDHQQFHMPLKNGQIEFQAPISSRISLNNAGLVGYWFDEEAIGYVDRPGKLGRARGFSIPEGARPFEYKIDVVPAGAIQANVISTESSVPVDLEEIDIECRRIDVPREQGGESISYATRHPNADGKLLITPVPLYGVYQLSAHLGNVTEIYSREIPVAPTDPMPEVELELPELTSRTVLVVDDEDRPVEDARVEIARSYPGSTKTTSRRTDRQGEVAFDMLESEALGEYRVWVIDDRYRPISEKRDLRNEKTVLRVE